MRDKVLIIRYKFCLTNFPKEIKKIFLKLCIGLTNADVRINMIIHSQWFARIVQNRILRNVNTVKSQKALRNAIAEVIVVVLL